MKRLQNKYGYLMGSVYQAQDTTCICEIRHSVIIPWYALEDNLQVHTTNNKTLPSMFLYIPFKMFNKNSFVGLEHLK